MRELSVCLIRQIAKLPQFIITAIRNITTVSNNTAKIIVLIIFITSNKIFDQCSNSVYHGFEHWSRWVLCVRMKRKAMSYMDKKELIINAMHELCKEGNGGTAAVSDIAKKAGIAKGGLYYYFRSKEEVLDALVERQYEGIIQSCNRLVEQSNESSIAKLVLLLKSYRSSYVDAFLDDYLHMPQNAAIHQKSLAKILSALSKIVSKIIVQGIEEGIFSCEYPQEYSEIIMSVFTFLLDPGIFTWTAEQNLIKMKALADLLEKGLSAKKGSFAFLYSS